MKLWECKATLVVTYYVATKDRTDEGDALKLAVENLDDAMDCTENPEVEVVRRVLPGDWMSEGHIDTVPYFAEREGSDDDDGDDDEYNDAYEDHPTCAEILAEAEAARATRRDPLPGQAELAFPSEL